MLVVGGPQGGVSPGRPSERGPLEPGAPCPLSVRLNDPAARAHLPSMFPTRVREADVHMDTHGQTHVDTPARHRRLSVSNSRRVGAACEDGGHLLARVTETLRPQGPCPPAQGPLPLLGLASPRSGPAALAGLPQVTASANKAASPTRGPDSLSSVIGPAQDWEGQAVEPRRCCWEQEASSPRAGSVFRASPCAQWAHSGSACGRIPGISRAACSC